MADGTPSQDVARQALAQLEAARKHAGRGNYGIAVSCILTCASNVPALVTDTDLEDELRTYLKHYSTYLVEAGQVEKAAWLYSNVCAMYRDSAPMHHDCALFYLKVGQTTKALEMLRTCLSLDSTFVVGLESLDNLTSYVIERWHFRMLNDRPRNSAYLAAIHATLQTIQRDKRVLQCGTVSAAGERGDRRMTAGSQGSADKVSVLDIGSGTGLLSIMCAQAGADLVYGCELNAPLAALANTCVAKAGVADRVTIIDKSSYHLTVGSEAPSSEPDAPCEASDLPGRVDLVVTELVDSGLLGEHILPTLTHARRHLLSHGGRVIPHSAEVHACVVDSDQLYRGARLDVSQLIRLPGCLKSSEPYTCESVCDVADLVYLTDSVCCGTILLDGSSDASVEVDADTQLVTFPPRALHVNVTGRAVAVLFWFDMCLLQGCQHSPEERASYHVTSAPERGLESGWDQGVFYVEPAHVRQHDTITLTMRHNCDVLSFSTTVVPSMQQHEQQQQQRQQQQLDTEFAKLLSAVQIADTCTARKECAKKQEDSLPVHTAMLSFPFLGETDLALNNDQTHMQFFLHHTLSHIQRHSSSMGDHTQRSSHVLCFTRAFHLLPYIVAQQSPSNHPRASMDPTCPASSVSAFSEQTHDERNQDCDGADRATFESAPIHVICHTPQELQFYRELCATVPCGALVVPHHVLESESEVLDRMSDLTAVIMGVFKLSPLPLSLVVDPVEASGLLRPQALRSVIDVGLILATHSRLMRGKMGCREDTSDTDADASITERVAERIAQPKRADALDGTAAFPLPDMVHVFPSTVEVWACVVESDELCRKNYVNCEDSLGIDLSDFNQFSVRTYRDINVETCDLMALAEGVCVARINMQHLLSRQHTQPLISGQSIPIHSPCTTNTEGKALAILYWVELAHDNTRLVCGSEHLHKRLCPSRVCDGENAVSFSPHIRAAAEFLPNPLSVKANQKIFIRGAIDTVRGVTLTIAK
eukprot:m.277150 g.277150  ORF g.277150 m.277150 type:complete len:989 (+) comp15719_c0_seq1:91-3057(+)